MKNKNKKSLYSLRYFLSLQIGRKYLEDSRKSGIIKPIWSNKKADIGFLVKLFLWVIFILLAFAALGAIARMLEIV